MLSTRTEARRRLSLARVVAAIFPLISAIILMGLIDLFTLPGWVNQDFEWELPLEVSWGALFTFFLAGAYVWVALYPQAPWPALVQLAICGLALLVAAVAGTDWRPLALATGVAVSGLLLWRLVGRPVPPLPSRPTVGALDDADRRGARVPAVAALRVDGVLPVTSPRARQHHPGNRALAGPGRGRRRPDGRTPRAGPLGRRTSAAPGSRQPLRGLHRHGGARLSRPGPAPWAASSGASASRCGDSSSP